MSTERVVIAKRAKYSPDGSGPLYSRADLAELAEYCASDTHPRHEGVVITQYSPVTADEFVEAAERGLGAFIAAPRRGPGAKVGQKKKGRPAQIEIAEHDVFSLPPDADLTPEERQQIAEGITQSAAYSGYPVMVFGHFMQQPFPGVPPWDLHVIAANFDLQGRYRVGKIKRRERDYAAAIARAADDVIAKINSARIAAGRAPIKGIRERRNQKRQEQGRPSMEQLIADRIAPLSLVTKAAIIAAIRALAADGWTVEIDDAEERATLTPPPRQEAAVNTRRNGRRQPRRRTYRANLAALLYSVDAIVHDRDLALRQERHKQALEIARKKRAETRDERRRRAAALDPVGEAERQKEMTGRLIAADRPVELIPTKQQNLTAINDRTTIL